jgi:DsbC/DsbD-like thiol-disulfide interchange protein
LTCPERSMAFVPLLLARCLAAVALIWPSLAAAQPAVLTTEHVRAELLAHAPAGVEPGKPLWLALALAHQPHWHSYWLNPGDSGLATTLSWQLDDGAIAGDIAWPTPQALKVGPLMNYGYEGTVLLSVPVTIPAGFQARELRVKLQAEWLVCKDVCVPESGEFSLTVPARGATTPHARRFEDALARVPPEPASLRGRAAIERRALRVEVDGLPPALRGREMRFFAETPGVFEHAAPVEQRWEEARWIARVPLSPQRSESPATMHAVLVPAGQPTGIRVRLPISGLWTTASSVGKPVTNAVAAAWPDNASPPVLQPRSER